MCMSDLMCLELTRRFDKLSTHHGFLQVTLSVGA
jgi:hypothetical protein